VNQIDAVAKDPYTKRGSAYTMTKS